MRATRNATGVHLRVALLLVCVLSWLAGVCPAPAQEAADPYLGSVRLDIEDGTYLVDVSLTGGTGRAHIGSPTTLAVRDGSCALTVVWSSPNYDYMVVDGTCYLPTTDGETSRFEIPLVALDEPFDVVADTVAMSVPHEIAYRIEVDSGSIVRAQDAPGQGIVPQALLVACTLGIGCALILRRRAG